MKLCLVTMGTLLFVLAFGCGGVDSSSGGGNGGGSSGGSGGTGGTVTTSSTTSTTSDTTTPPVTEEVGPLAGCTGLKPYAPFYAPLDQDNFPTIDLVDDNGLPIDGTNGLVCRRVTPTKLPAHFVSWKGSFIMSLSICQIAPTAVSFVAPTEAQYPIVLQDDAHLAVTALDPLKTKFELDLDITITEAGKSLYVCEQLPIDPMNGHRGCASMCAHADGDVLSTDVYWSNTNASGMIDELPTVSLKHLSEAPTKAIADHFGSGKYEPLYTVLVEYP